MSTQAPQRRQRNGGTKTKQQRGRKTNGKSKTKSNGNNSRNTTVQTSNSPSNRARQIQNGINTVYDGTGRLYECMSVAELNIRLRNLADHCLDTHHDNVARREQLIRDIKDIQKTVDDLLKELKDQVLKQIKENAARSGEQEEALVKLQKENEALRGELAYARKIGEETEKQHGNFEKGLQQETAALKKEMNEKLARLNAENLNLKQNINDLRKQLEQSGEEISARDKEINKLNDTIRDNNNRLKDLKSENASLRSQSKAKDKQRRSLPGVTDAQLQGRIDELQRQNKQLGDDLAKARNEAKSKEQTIGDLIATNKQFENKLGKQLQDQFNAFLAKADEVQMARRDTEDLKKYYKEQLDKMHKIWEDASNDIRKVFDRNYEELRNKLENAYNDCKTRNDELEVQNKRLQDRAKELSNAKLAADKQINELIEANDQNSDQLNGKDQRIEQLHNENVDLQVKISQYRVVWNHYMMLEGKLKNEIGHLEQSVHQFEDQMNVDAPMAKKRKVSIGRIAEYSNGRFLPIELSEVPIPELLYHEHHYPNRNMRRKRRSASTTEDEKVDVTDIDNERFLLVNSSRNTSITLEGEWFLVNDRNERVPLPRNLELAPTKNIGICMGNKRQEARDVVLGEYRSKNNQPFITFAKATDELYLQDTVGMRIPLFTANLPSRIDAIEAEMYKDEDNDIEGGEITSALRLPNYIQLSEVVRKEKDDEKPHIDFMNVTRNPIILRNFTLRRNRGTFKMRFPEIEITNNKPVRLLFANEKDSDDDVLIPPQQFGPLDGKDTLVLEDATGARFNLFTDFGNPTSPDYNNTPQDDACFVM